MSAAFNFCEGQDVNGKKKNNNFFFPNLLIPIISQVALVAHAIDSRKYYRCGGADGNVIFQCVDNQFFDEEKSRCV